jgi:hypothetical protein
MNIQFLFLSRAGLAHEASKALSTALNFTKKKVTNSYPTKDNKNRNESNANLDEKAMNYSGFFSVTTCCKFHVERCCILLSLSRCCDGTEYFMQILVNQ